MIENFQRIENFAVFKSFDWGSHVCDPDGTELTFKKLNIIYGRNYCGKTTLSRIARALENGTIDEKFNGPKFSVRFSCGLVVNQDNPCEHGRAIRVFNEDFVKDNLRFIFDANEDIKAFAILGEDNNKLEAEIQSLEEKLGLDVPGAETGLQLEKLLASERYENAVSTLKAAEKSIEDLCAGKATKGPNSIRNQPTLYGDQNYNIAKMNRDIASVLKPGFEAASAEAQDALKLLLKEEVRADIASQDCPKFDLASLIDEVSSVVTRDISRSSKIDAFLKDAALNRWANEGRRLHALDHSDCKFCGSVISADRWAELESHFDSESDKLETDILNLEAKVRSVRNILDAREGFSTSLFYSRFHSRVNNVEQRAVEAIRSCRAAVGKLLGSLGERKSNVLSALAAPIVVDSSRELAACYDEYEKLRLESNQLSNTLTSDQGIARETLRLAFVHEFVESIGYTSQMEQIAVLKGNVEDTENYMRERIRLVTEAKLLIAENRRRLNDEEQGAVRVNELLNSFFGNHYLSLQAIERGSESGTKQVRFEVIRNSEKAYHLSEGERSLLAFCYFVAKLEEAETAGENPIVWIDDPISSLDGNHIFFVFSVINEHLHDRIKCKQIFISTHSLEFLKYLRRLPDANQDRKTKEHKRLCRYLIAERNDDVSVLVPMPRYMQDYVTEFNYLFDQIYRCATISIVDDTNYRDFYSFGNNARKFLEIYLYYAYPDTTPDSEKMAKFFGDAGVPVTLVDRVNNEYSHMSGVFERGSTPIVQPEMRSCANLILDRLKRQPEQYSALLRSIGKLREAEDFIASSIPSTGGVDGEHTLPG